jgi:glycosyltransferase involved in cell wall biosynthesis
LITLIAPASDNYLTGGYIYNKEISDRFASDDIFSYYTVDARSNLSFLQKANPIVLDSLFIRHPDLLFPIINKTSGPRFLGLIHFLPSLDPFLTAGVRKSMQYRELRFLAGLDAYFTTSGYMKQVLTGLGVPETKITVCPPGVDPRFIKLGEIRQKEKRDFRTGDCRRILTVSAITRSKNLLWLLRILESLTDNSGEKASEDIAPWEWRIAGSCPAGSRYASLFRRAVEESPLRERTTLLGPIERSGVLELLTEADLFLFPSAAESYGMAPLEAAAAGVPVVTNRVGAIEEFIREGENGHILSPFDREGWRNTLKTFLLDGSRTGQTRTERFHTNDGPQTAFSTWDEAAVRFKQHLEQYLR